MIKSKLRTNLTGGRIKKPESVPFLHQSRLTRRNDRYKFTVFGLQCSIATAMVAVQLCVDQKIQRPLTKFIRDQLKCLDRMGAVTAVDGQLVLVSSNKMQLDESQPRSKTCMPSGNLITLKTESITLPTKSRCAIRGAKFCQRLIWAIRL